MNRESFKKKFEELMFEVHFKGDMDDGYSKVDIIMSELLDTKSTILKEETEEYFRYYVRQYLL